MGWLQERRRRRAADNKEVAARVMGRLASSPTTPPGLLARIAQLEARLRPVVARNPSTPPSVREWLSTLGDPEIDRALREFHP